MKHKIVAVCILLVAFSSVVLSNARNAESYSQGTKILHYGSSPFYIGEEDADTGNFYEASATQSGLQTVQFSPDGSRLFTTDYLTDSVYQYDLAVPFIVAGATPAGSFSVVAQEFANPIGLTFNSAGTKMFVVGIGADTIFSYTLSSAYDVTTASYDGAGAALVVAAQEGSPNAIVFNNDGTKLFLAGQNSVGTGGTDAVQSFTLSTPYDLSTASLDGASHRLLLNNIQSINFSPNGHIFVMNTSTNVRTFELANAFDLSSSGGAFSTTFQSYAGVPSYFDFFDDGTKLVYASGTRIYEHAVNPSLNGFEENPNDGTVDGELKISLFSDTFQDIDSDNHLDVPSEVILNNVPSGLTPIMTLSQSDTVVTLSFSGTANNHQPFDDISDLGFVFLDSAFVGGDAGAVTNAGDGGMYEPGAGITYETNDNDGDGVYDEVEDELGNGDNNDDGTPDSEQAEVVTIANPVLEGYVAIEIDSDDGCNALSEVSAIDESDYVNPDPDYNYPAGLFNFVAVCDSPGDTARVSIYFDRVLDLEMARKLFEDGPSYDLAEGLIETVSINGGDVTKLTYDIADGDTTDLDGVVNSEIVDPVGLAQIQTQETVTTTTLLVPAPSTGVGSGSSNLPITGVYSLSTAAFGLMFIFAGLLIVCKRARRLI